MRLCKLCVGLWNYLKSKHLRHLIVNSLLVPLTGNFFSTRFKSSCSKNNMHSTVKRRRVVYILAKRERSQTVSLTFLRILLNEGYNMLINTKNLRWYRNWWIICMRMTSLTLCCCPGFRGCIFLKEISSKYIQENCSWIKQILPTKKHLSWI